MKDLLLYLFYQLIVRPWLTLIIGVRFSNRQVFDNVRQFIVVANHSSHFDMVSIMAALPWRKLKTPEELPLPTTSERPPSLPG